MAEIKIELLEKAVKLAETVGHVFIATSDRNGWPHVAAAHMLKLREDGRIDVREWFCPGTMSNLQDNHHLSIVVWEANSDTGYQLLGEMEEINDLGMVDGYAPHIDGKSPVPQVLRQLLVHVDRVLGFKRAPHSDVEE